LLSPAGPTDRYRAHRATPTCLPGRLGLGHPSDRRSERRPFLSLPLAPPGVGRVTVRPFAKSTKSRGRICLATPIYDASHQIHPRPKLKFRDEHLHSGKEPRRGVRVYEKGAKCSGSKKREEDRLRCLQEASLGRGQSPRRTGGATRTVARRGPGALLGMAQDWCRRIEPLSEE